jgi:hypothetical protein
MQLEIKTEGVDFVVSRAPQPKNDNDGRQKSDRETGAPLHVTELVAMDDTGAEVIKVTTAGAPRVVKRQLVTVARLVATPWISTDAVGWRFGRTGSSRCCPPRRVRRGLALAHRRVPRERPGDQRPGAA